MQQEQNRQLKDKFMLRFPDGMRGALKVMAAESERSMNAEIIFHLRKAVLAATNEKDRQGGNPDGLMQS
ncbi:Arc family DNA-binding protein [Paracoccus sp. (in: a-proteobacteria)]|uniref:Arc family DNA-binding protein n=1 Tax=Paracoccus sp. TaxID=267 RepID=UPI0028B07875|nr:Arc family DNA-binding protein [Paracoccus sp. (in: a-proteobacteria)]